MARPTGPQQIEMETLENHAATIGRLIEVLGYAHRNATIDKERRAIEREIEYHIKQLAVVHVRRDALQRLLSRGRG